MEFTINKLRGRMGELGINLSQLAKITGISRPSLRYIINGERRPREETTKKICQALRIDEKDVLFYFPSLVPNLSTEQKGD